MSCVKYDLYVLSNFDLGIRISKLWKQTLFFQYDLQSLTNFDFEIRVPKKLFNPHADWGGGGLAHVDFNPLYYMEAFELTSPNFLTFKLCMLTVVEKNWGRLDNSKRV